MSQVSCGELKIFASLVDAPYQAMSSEATQIAAHAPRRVVPGVDAEEAGEMDTQLCIGEPLSLCAEHHQRVEQGLSTGLAEAQPEAVINRV